MGKDKREAYKKDIMHRKDEEYLQDHKLKLVEYSEKIGQNHATGTEHLAEATRHPERRNIYLSKHFSWDDILITAHTFITNDFRIPLMIGGKNALRGGFTTPGIFGNMRSYGIDLRKSGYVVLDRDKISEPTYRKALFEVAQDIAKSGEDILGYFERFVTKTYPDGKFGRSPDGRMGDINTGFVKTFLSGTPKGQESTIIPLSVSHEIIPDIDGIYCLGPLKEKKERLNARWIFRGQKRLAKEIWKGDFYEFVEHYEEGLGKINHSHLDVGVPLYNAQEMKPQDIAAHVEDEYKRLTRITPAALVGKSLQGEKEINYATLHNLVEDDVATAYQNSVLESYSVSHAHNIEDIVALGIIGLNGTEEFIAVEGKNVIINEDFNYKIDHYANTIEHCFE